MNGKYQVGTIAQSLNLDWLGTWEAGIVFSDTNRGSISSKLWAIVPTWFETFVGEDGQEYVKVKVVEYEMLSVMALEGVKLLFPLSSEQ